MLEKIKREIITPALEEIVRDTAGCILETDPHALTAQRIDGSWYVWITEYPEDGGIDITAFDVLTRGRPRLAAQHGGRVFQLARRAASVGFWSACFAFIEERARDEGYEHAACEVGCPLCERTATVRDRAERALDALRGAP